MSQHLPPPKFAHLHVHTEFSFLDGSGSIKKLVQRTKELGMQHLAITDHGGLHGVIAFHAACQDAGIHPVFGCEAYLTHDLHDRGNQHNEDYHHILLARNNTGYRNLMKLTTIAHTEGYHVRPRIDKKTLEQYAQGLITTSGCLSAEIPRLLLAGKQQEAYRSARWHQDVFGPDNFYLELQRHHGTWDHQTTSPQGRLNRLLYQMHKNLKAPLIATNDVHYVTRQDAYTHDLLLCIQKGNQIKTPGRLKFDSHEYYLKSPLQMHRLFPELPDALTNTIRLAEQCQVNPLAMKTCLPDIAIPPHYPSAEAYLAALCQRGAQERYRDLPDQIQRRLAYELQIICAKGFARYFLIVWDYINYARTRGILYAARGSVAGSLLAYVLNITNIDPLRHQLLFERFLNPERTDMPDIDVDFPDDQREEIVRYLREKYGEANVAHMATFTTMAVRQSVKDIAHAMGHTALGEHLARLIPSKGTLDQALAHSPELLNLYREHVAARQILEQARKLEGTVRAIGTHPAGIILARDPLEQIVPLQIRDTEKPNKGMMAQFGHAHLECLGITKFDLLCLSILRVLRLASSLIKVSQGEEVTLDQIPLDPTNAPRQEQQRAEAFKLLQKGHTTGLFMVESAGITRVLRKGRPTSIDDLAAIISLYRPGPIDNIPAYLNAKEGRLPVAYLDERLKPYLEPSYGVIIYQDQVLQIVNDLAGFSWDQVNMFRQALSKKKGEEIKGYKGEFIRGCLRKGLKAEIAEQLFEQILPFGGYGFNKANAVSFATLTYYSAYLKANYPAAYLAAMMTVAIRSPQKTKMASAVAECKRMGVEILAPDVNRSCEDFTLENRGIRFGLLAIKDIGPSAIGAILQERTSGGPFTSFANFCTRINPQAVTRGTIETLIKVGALDSLERQPQRHVLLASVGRALRHIQRERTAREHGQISLFDELEGADNALEFQLTTTAQPIPRTQLLAWEREYLKAYVTEHPLASISDILDGAEISHTLGQLEEVQDNTPVTLCGMVVECEEVMTRKNKKMCLAHLEDLSGSLKILIPPHIYERTQSIWCENTLVLARGRVQHHRDTVSIICHSASHYSPSAPSASGQHHQL